MGEHHERSQLLSTGELVETANVALFSRPQIVLTGFMGAGKSTLGALLARRLQAPFYDSDVLIENETGLTIAELFDRNGEAAFREIEHRVISRVASASGTILALGGGALGHTGTRRCLASTHIIYLEINVAIAQSRIGDATDRPMVRTHNLGRLLSERDAIYRTMATSVLHVNEGEGPTTTLERLWALLPDQFHAPTAEPGLAG